MCKVKKFFTILAAVLIFFVSCTRSASEVVLDFEAKKSSAERISLLVEAQIVREHHIDAAGTTQERRSRKTLAKNAEKQILESLNPQERKMYRKEIVRKRFELDNLNHILNPLQTAFYQDLPTIQGVTVDVPSHFFSVDLVLAYDATNRKLANDIMRSRLAITAQLRNLLMRYPANAFLHGQEELLREPMRQNINKTLAHMGSRGSITRIFITKFEVYEIPN